MAKKNDLKKEMILALAHALDAHVTRAIPRIEERLKNELYGLIRATKEFEALITGPLDGHFGFEIGTAAGRIEAITRAASKQVKVFEPVFNGGTARGRMLIGFFLSNFKVLTSMDEAQVFNVGTFENLEWLKWLLFNGDQVFIMSKIKPEPYWMLEKPLKSGRSKKALMLKVTVKNKRSPWRIPTIYSGTKDDNWFTRSMMETIDVTRDIIIKVIQEELGGTP